MASTNLCIVLSILMLAPALSFPTSKPSPNLAPTPTPDSTVPGIVSSVANSALPPPSPKAEHGTGHINMTAVNITGGDTDANEDVIIIPSTAAMESAKRDEAPANNATDSPNTQDWRDRMAEFSWSYGGMYMDIWINKIRLYGSIKINIPPQYRKSAEGKLDRGFGIKMDSWDDWRPRGILNFWIEGGHELWMGGDFKWDQKQIVGENIMIYEW